MYQSIWNWIQQKYRPKKIFERKKKIEEFIIDETLIKIGSELIDMALGCYYYRI
jgi:putative transposase